MDVNQRDVYLLPHPINPKTEEPHPYIILSDRKANRYERCYLAVMITGSEFKKDHFSFPLTDAMFEDGLDKDGCHARMHLIALFLDEDIIGKRLTRMKEKYFNQLMKSIGDLIFDFNFSPNKQLDELPKA